MAGKPRFPNSVGLLFALSPGERKSVGGGGEGAGEGEFPALLQDRGLTGSAAPGALGIFLCGGEELGEWGKAPGGPSRGPHPHPGGAFLGNRPKTGGQVFVLSV